jgi:hypothetical protein
MVQLAYHPPIHPRLTATYLPFPLYLILELLLFWYISLRPRDQASLPDEELVNIERPSCHSVLPRHCYCTFDCGMH